MADDSKTEKPEDMSDEDWKNFGKPDDDLEYDDNEQPVTKVVGDKDE